MPQPGAQRTDAPYSLSLAQNSFSRNRGLPLSSQNDLFCGAYWTQMKPAYLIILLLFNFFWAAVYSAYKILGQQLSTGAIVTLRFGLAGLCLLFAWPFLPGLAPRGRDLVKTCAIGVMMCVV